MKNLRRLTKRELKSIKGSGCTKVRPASNCEELCLLLTMGEAACLSAPAKPLTCLDPCV
jgi:hypothetical protein